MQMRMRILNFRKVRMRMWMRMLILMRMRMRMRILILMRMGIRVVIIYIYIYIYIFIYFTITFPTFVRWCQPQFPYKHNYSYLSTLFTTSLHLSLSPQIFYPLLNSNSFHQNPSHSIHPSPLLPSPPPTLPLSTSDLRTLPTILSSFILHVCPNHFSTPSSALSITPFFHLHISFILSFRILSILLNFHIALKPFISKALKLFLARELIINV